MNVLGIIPARAGSKRLPGKNLRLLAGRPLAAWVMDQARQARRLARIVVSSDDPGVLSLAAEHDPSWPLERPAALAGDESPAMDYVRHALGALEGAGAPRFDAVCILQPSSPLTLAADIDGTIELAERTGAESAVSIVAVDHAVHPLKLKRLEGDRLLPYWEPERGRMAAHELPPLYVRNCAVYVTRRDVLDRGLILGDDCRGYLMPRERSLDINEPIDLEFAEFLVARHGLSPAATG